MVTVYTKNNCQPCRLTKRELTKVGVEFQEVNLDENPALAAELAAEGFLSAPVVKTSEGASWAGFAPAKVRALAATKAA